LRWWRLRLIAAVQDRQVHRHQGRRGFGMFEIKSLWASSCIFCIEVRLMITSYHCLHIKSSKHPSVLLQCADRTYRIRTATKRVYD
jgi:hypothetical protein